MAFGRLTLTQNQYYYNQQPSVPPQLNKTFVFGKILNSFATLTYIEEFTTKNEDFYEIYINPPEGCVVYDVKAKYNDKTTEFVVHQLEEPTINGYCESNSNSDAINLTLGLIPEKITVKLEISCTFTAILNSNNQSFSFHLPSDSTLLNTDFSADIEVINYNPEKSKISISEGKHTIENNNHIIIHQFKPSKDLQIIFNFNDNIESTAFSTKIDNYNYIGLSLLPNLSFDFSSNMKQEIYLLIDCSGSMSGSKILNAQIALKNFLKELPKNCYFNILRFGSTFEQMFETSVENNKNNIKQSLSYAETLKADLGGTDIYSPLMSVIGEKPKKGYVRQVFAITDGEVQSPANVIAACTKARNIMRVFPFGIGYDVNCAFLNELAKSTMGEAHFIADKSSKEISDKVLSALKSSQVGAIVNNEVHIEGVDSFEVAPHPIPSMFKDNFTHVIVRYKEGSNNGDLSIMINGESGDNSYEDTVSVSANDDSINLQKLFAYHNIRDMEDQMLNSDGSDKAKLIKENIVRLSVQCAVVSSFTGMFTVINGVEQKQEDLQKEMEKYNEELIRKQEKQMQQQHQQLQKQAPQPQQQMFQPQQPILQPQQQMFQPQQPILQPQQQMFQPQPQMFQPQPQMFQPQQQMFQPQQQMFQPQQQMFQPQQQMFQPQPQMFQPQQQMFQPQPQMFQPQPQMFQPQQQMFQPQPQMFQPQQQMFQPQQQMFQPQPQMFQQQQQMFQPQMQQCCQQPITQKQCRNQIAFSQVNRPIMQAKQMWGNQQVHQQSSQKIVRQQMPHNQIPQKQMAQKQVVQKQRPPMPSKMQTVNDQVISDLLNRQNASGSWSDSSLIEFLVKMKTKNPTCKDLLTEYPCIEHQMKDLIDECIITLLVIGWLYSQRTNLLSLFEKEARKGIEFVCSKTNSNISDVTRLTNGISWKSF